MTIFTTDFFDYSGSLAAALLSRCRYPWEALPLLKDYLLDLISRLPREEYDEVEEQVFVHHDAVLAPSAYLHGPCIIAKGAEIRHCAFIRGTALIGENSVVGNSSELKNSLLIGSVQLPHYNYAGDSIFGRASHMGAGSITSNVKADHGNVQIKFGQEVIETGLRKFGAILGDKAEIGCNAVLNPGTLIGPASRVYPCSMVRGIVPPHSIYKKAGEIAEITEHP